MTDDDITHLLAMIETLLRDPTCQVHVARGIHRRPGADGFWVYEPTEGRTIRIEVQGGARETESDPLWWAMGQERGDHER